MIAPVVQHRAAIVEPVPFGALLRAIDGVEVIETTLERLTIERHNMHAEIGPGMVQVGRMLTKDIFNIRRAQPLQNIPDGDVKAKQVLSAFAVNTALVLAHIEIDEKSNEIPAVQKLLEELDDQTPEKSQKSSSVGEPGLTQATALALPSLVHDRIDSRSNSASLPKTVSIKRPTVIVSFLHFGEWAHLIQRTPLQCSCSPVALHIRRERDRSQSSEIG